VAHGPEHRTNTTPQPRCTAPKQHRHRTTGPPASRPSPAAGRGLPTAEPRRGPRANPAKPPPKPHREHRPNRNRRTGALPKTKAALWV